LLLSWFTMGIIFFNLLFVTLFYDKYYQLKEI